MTVEESFNKKEAYPFIQTALKGSIQESKMKIYLKIARKISKLISNQELAWRSHMGLRSSRKGRKIYKADQQDRI